ncbi:MAG: DUF3820 family protein [Chitinophagales bacterium]|nr:DUF3820 family protein [Chitinophagales bacterium]
MPDKVILLKIIETKMPYGKYKDRWLDQIPVSYLEWMRNNDAMPKGKLGMLLETLYVIKTNGLEHLLRPLIPKER